MTKATKYIVLVAGLIGIIAFFLPLISVADSGVEGKLSAYQIVTGIDSAQDVVGGAASSSSISTAEANAALGAVKGIVLAIFAPAAFLLLFGGIGAARKKFGRGLAIPSMIFGLIGLAIWALLNAAASEAGTGESAAGIGMHMLLLTGLFGTLGGLFATVKPDRSRLAS